MKFSTLTAVLDLDVTQDKKNRCTECTHTTFSLHCIVLILLNKKNYYNLYSYVLTKVTHHVSKHNLTFQNTAALCLNCFQHNS